MRRDAALVVERTSQDEGELGFSDMIVAIGWTIIVTLLGVTCVGLFVFYTI